ncbi:Hypothetical protein HEAR1913 [Herminiimonas arsenicoxydans]|uniref:Uncharacterized protein n=1 Tax=Herminiimonas arsenicoxydans TaxID=204773 RepID=A4G6C6_HERAR|nr:Hypothetical protein HEAR1913 [Herminiimonas arsenicoxydans]
MLWSLGRSVVRLLLGKPCGDLRTRPSEENFKQGLGL